MMNDEEGRCESGKAGVGVVVCRCVGAGAGGLKREDWDFSKVPREEWMPALIWEMNRECDVSDAGQTGEAFGLDICLLVRAVARPWLCLRVELRRLLAGSHEECEAGRVVTVGDFRHGAGDSLKGDAALRLEAGSPASTPVVLIINWEHSLKKILGATAGILKQLQPRDARPMRGRKKRDILVALERLAIMRLLHHYTLSEIKRELPDAWRLYQNRKWYYERRRALEVFRSIVRAEGKPFPRSWATSGQSRRQEHFNPKTWETSNIEHRTPNIE